MAGRTARGKGYAARVDVRFGIAISTSAREGADPVADARHAESLGFDLLTVSDHLVGSQPSFETWTLLTWLASATSRVLVAPTVLGLPYRHPPVVAKMAESLQRLSGGRLVLGLGGGGNDREFEAFGLTLRSPGEKVDALEEEIGVLRALWTGEPSSLQGKHFELREAQITPSPSTPIPIWLGTYGSRALELTGRLADGWNPSMPYMPPEIAAKRRGRVLAAAEAAGRDPGEITCSYNLSVTLREDAPEQPNTVVGGPDRVAEELAGLARLGFPFLVFWLRGGAEARERMASEVFPLVRDALR